VVGPVSCVGVLPSIVVGVSPESLDRLPPSGSDARLRGTAHEENAHAQSTSIEEWQHFLETESRCIGGDS
jgi:hypothetical protein